MRRFNDSAEVSVNYIASKSSDQHKVLLHNFR